VVAFFIYTEGTHSPPTTTTTMIIPVSEEKPPVKSSHRDDEEPTQLPTPDQVRYKPHLTHPHPIKTSYY